MDDLQIIPIERIVRSEYFGCGVVYHKRIVGYEYYQDGERIYPTTLSRETWPKDTLAFKINWMLGGCL